LAFVLLAVLLFRKAWSAPGGTWIGLGGDPPLHMWFLRWTPWALGHGMNPLFTHHINAPDGVNLMWNTAEPLTALVMAPVTLLIGVIPAYNVVITLAVALSGWCFYLFIRRHVTHELAAVVGGLLYGFSPYMIGQALTHSNLVQAYIPPLLCIVAEDILVHQRRSSRASGALLGGLLAAQLFITEELVVYEVLALSVGALVLAASHWRDVRPRVPHVLRSLGAGVVVAALIVGGPLAFQFFGPRHPTHGVVFPPEALSADVLSFVVPSDLQQVRPSWSHSVTDKFSNSCCIDEQGSYVGLPLLVLLIVTAARAWRRDLVKVAAVVGVCFLVLALGPHLHVGGVSTSTSMPRKLFDHVRLLQSVQPVRLMLVAWLAAAALLAVFADAVLRRRHHAPMAVAGAAAGLLALVPVLPTFRFPATEANVPKFFTSAAVARVPRDSVVLVSPFARDPSTSEPMLWQAEARFRFRMPDGYILGPDANRTFITLPERTPLSEALAVPQRGEQAPPLTPELRQTYGYDLDRWGVTSVLVGRQLYEEDVRAFMTELLGRSPERVDGVWLWRHVDGRQVASAAGAG
jgi:hypothetical protein